MMNCKKMLRLSAVILINLFFMNQVSAGGNGLSVSKTGFGQLSDGSAVELFSLTNQNGMVVKITNYGGIITSILVPDKQDNLIDVVLGFDNLEDYTKEHPYFGAIIGRYGNRIRKGKFALDGQEFTLAVNNGPNHLHGGLQGFDKVLWTAETKPDKAALSLSYISKDMEEGYPGNLEVTVEYALNNNNELSIAYKATTDKRTVVNLTNHTYFNLRGAGNGNILNHELMINASNFTPVDDTLIPTGEIRPVKNTPFDFGALKAIGSRINQGTEQLKFGGGYDHNFVLNKKGQPLELAAKVLEPDSGRKMEVYTTEPGLQFYSGNFLDGTLKGKNDSIYKFRYGFCLETQHFPDSPNQGHFPSVVLNPGETYASATTYRFSF